MYFISFSTQYIPDEESAAKVAKNIIYIPTSKKTVLLIIYLNWAKCFIENLTIYNIFNPLNLY